MALPSLDEIKERKLVQWGLAYLGGAWLGIQVIAAADAEYDWPSGLVRGLHVVLAVGFLVALVVAWYHGERGAQKVSGVELAILTGLLVVAGLGVMIVGGGEADAAPDDAETELVGLPGPQVEQTTLAVLPFETIGGDAFFAAGLTDALHQTLSRVAALRVTAKTSSGAFEGSTVPADSIGRALKVAHLVEGSVRDIGDGRVRITARLVDATDGRQEWSETYDRDVADMFAVQEEIAQAVAYQLRVEVGTSAIAGVGASPNPEAYALVLQATQLIQRGGGEVEAQVREAMRLYGNAIALDSIYAAAWAGQARSRWYLAGTVTPDEDEQARERALAISEARRALALDPNEGQAHLVLGWAAFWTDPETARGHFEQAVAASPANTQPLASLARIHVLLGDEAGALRMAERVVDLDPLSILGLNDVAYVYTLVGQHERAVELSRAALALKPDDNEAVMVLAVILAYAGEVEEPIALASRALDVDPRHVWARTALAVAHANAGNRAEAERHVAGLPGGRSFYVRGILEAILGNRDAAFEALERSVETEGREVYGGLVIHPGLRSLHDDPRWKPLVARVRAGWGQD